jgi:hypothetical protein
MSADGGETARRKGGCVPMAEKKRTSPWAVASLVCSALGSLAFLALLPLGERYGEMARGSAGVAGVWAALHVALSAALCLLGGLFGVIALARIRGGRYGGRVMAWAGIALGCLPWALALLFSRGADFNLRERGRDLTGQRAGHGRRTPQAGVPLLRARNVLRPPGLSAVPALPGAVGPEPAEGSGRPLRRLR